MKTKSKKLKIPKGYTEEEVVDILNRVAAGLATKFKFGYHDIEDMKQQAILEGLDALSRYDGGQGPLENFLWVHVKNRLFNFKRDNYERISKPCYKCPLKKYDKENDSCEIYNDDELQECRFYAKWIKINDARRNLVNIISVDNVEDEKENRMSTMVNYEECLDAKEIDRMIQDALPPKYWGDYDRFKCGAKLNYLRKKDLLVQINQILEENGIDTTYGQKPYI
jgi:DNA-directed RNA polymerase specialized sigma subunit